MKYIIAILVVVTIMHDISLWRLNHKVEVLIAFFSETLHKLEDGISGQTDCPWK